MQQQNRCYRIIFEHLKDAEIAKSMTLILSKSDKGKFLLEQIEMCVFKNWITEKYISYAHDMVYKMIDLDCWWRKGKVDEIVSFDKYCNKLIREIVCARHNCRDFHDVVH